MSKTFTITAADIGVTGRFTMGGEPAMVLALLANDDSDLRVAVKVGEPGSERMTAVSDTGYNFCGPDLRLIPRKGFIAVRIGEQLGGTYGRRAGRRVTGSRACATRQDALDSIHATGGEQNVHVFEVDLPE